MQRILKAFFVLGIFWAGCQSAEPTYDLIIRQGMVYDGSGGEGVLADVAIQGDTIAAIGTLSNAKGRTEINAHGQDGADSSRV